MIIPLVTDNGPAKAVNAVVECPAIPGKVWFASDEGLFYSFDGHRLLKDRAYVGPVQTLAVTDQDLWIGGSFGLRRRTDGVEHEIRFEGQDNSSEISVVKLVNYPSSSRLFIQARDGSTERIYVCASGASVATVIQGSENFELLAIASDGNLLATHRDFKGLNALDERGNEFKSLKRTKYSVWDVAQGVQGATRFYRATDRSKDQGTASYEVYSYPDHQLLESGEGSFAFGLIDGEPYISRDEGVYSVNSKELIHRHREGDLRTRLIEQAAGHTWLISSEAVYRRRHGGGESFGLLLKKRGVLNDIDYLSVGGGKVFFWGKGGAFAVHEGVTVEIDLNTLSVGDTEVLLEKALSANDIDYRGHKGAEPFDYGQIDRKFKIILEDKASERNRRRNVGKYNSREDEIFDPEKRLSLTVYSSVRDHYGNIVDPAEQQVLVVGRFWARVLYFVLWGLLVLFVLPFFILWLTKASAEFGRLRFAIYRLSGWLHWILFLGLSLFSFKSISFLKLVLIVPKWMRDVLRDIYVSSWLRERDLERATDFTVYSELLSTRLSEGPIGELSTREVRSGMVLQGLAAQVALKKGEEPFGSAVPVVIHCEGLKLSGHSTGDIAFVKDLVLAKLGRYLWYFNRELLEAWLERGQFVFLFYLNPTEEGDLRPQVMSFFRNCGRFEANRLVISPTTEFVMAQRTEPASAPAAAGDDDEVTLFSILADVVALIDKLRRLRR